MTTTRRQVLVAISQYALAAVTAPHARSAEQNSGTRVNSDLELLASIAYDILPYDELPSEVYVRAAQQILDLHDAEVTSGLTRLRELSSNTRWLDATEENRIAALTAVQDSAFFRVLRTNTVQVLLRDPATFAIVGYGGPSIQLGGYLNRGFNDIRWLPTSMDQ